MDRKELKQVSVEKLTNGGYSASLMKAERLVGDHVHGLPEGKPIMAVPIHCLPGAPEGWIRDSGTYVVEVDAQHGLWFDWSDNDKYNVAVVPTVKGMNPITGLKTEDVAMHQYREKCPKHNTPFAHNNFCEECGYTWPSQNYISHPNILWWDGFRGSDGSVRQFFFSEEEQRDVASQIIGKKNTVPAFGFAFYRCKNERRPKMDSRARGAVFTKTGSCNFGGIRLDDSPSTEGYDPKDKIFYSTSSSSSSSNHPSSSSSSSSLNKNVIKAYNSSNVMSFCDDLEIIERSDVDGILTVSENAISPRYLSPRSSMGGNPVVKNKNFKEENAQDRAVKDVSVGAGARINQFLEIDKTPLEEWGKNPESVITLYFVFSEQMEEIIKKGGVKKLESKPEGYLEDVIVG